MSEVKGYKSEVKVYKNDVEGALKRFKANSAKNKTTSLVKDKQHYTKPGVKKRLAKQEAIKNARKKEKKDNRRD